MALLCLLLTGIIGYFVFVYVFNGDRNPPSRTNTSSSKSWIAGSYKVGPTSLKLGPREVEAFPLKLNEGWRKIRLIGKFEARGQHESEIELGVTDEAGVANCKSQRVYRSWYSTGRMIKGSINADLPPQKLFLVVINPFPHQKFVSLDIELQYERLVE